MKIFFPLAMVLASSLFVSSCASNAASAEEYFSIGMAYFDFGKYEEAEMWLNRAKSMDKTMVASEYNLGRIAFATGRFEEAAERFESILVKDPYNVMALKGAAYSRIKNGDLAKARELYVRVLNLVPESADAGFNYALVLYAMGDFESSVSVLAKYDYSLEENNDALLLYARAQGAANYPEAVDSYGMWLENNTNADTAQVRYEYGKELEKLELYAKAMEQYQAGFEEKGNNPPKKDFLFEIGKLLLIADPESDDGISKLEEAIEAGFDDVEAFDELLADSRISDLHKERIDRMAAGLTTPEPESSESSEQPTEEEIE